jgi:tetratricopeptide (TPR) repeat protein
MMARHLLQTGHTRDARLVLDRALEWNPVDADLWALLAETRGRCREYEEAARCIQRALAIDPFNATALNNQMVLLLETGDGPGLEAFFESFPADELSLPEQLRNFVQEVRRNLQEHGGPAGSPAFVTEERLFDWLQASTLGAGPSLAIERFAVCDVVSPGTAEDFRGTGVLFVAATTNFSDELPLAEVRLKTNEQSIALRALKERIRLVPEEREEIAVRLGKHLYEGVFSCPLRKGVIEIDFAKRRTHMQLLASTRVEEPEGPPPTDEALLAMAAREFPVMFPSDAERDQ